MTGSQRERRDYVAEDAVLVLNKGHMRCSVRAVFDPEDGGGNILPGALVVDEPESGLVPAALVSGGDGACAVAAGVRYSRNGQFRDNASFEYSQFPSRFFERSHHLRLLRNSVHL